MKLTSKTILLVTSTAVMLIFILLPPMRVRANEDGTLRVTVRDSSAAVVVGVTVTAKRKPCRCEDCSAEQKPCRCCIQQVTTNDEGQATFTVSPGTYDVTVEGSGFKRTEQQGVQVGAGETRIEINLDSGAVGEVVQVSGPSGSAWNKDNEFVLSGRVLNENKQPLANVEILLTKADWKTDCRCESCSEKAKPCKCCFAQRVMSDASGYFSVSGLKPSDYYVRLIKDGQTAGSFNGLEIRQSEKVLFTVQESKAGGPNF